MNAYLVSNGVSITNQADLASEDYLIGKGQF